MASSRVMALRTLQLASSDRPAACREAERMWSETLFAHAGARLTLLHGLPGGGRRRRGPPGGAAR